MLVHLKDAGIRFNNTWIFNHLENTFKQNEYWHITGGNGSGKSTLLQLLSGILSPSNGTIEFDVEGQTLDQNKVFSQISIAAPYAQLLEKLTLAEAIDFHLNFKPNLAFNSSKEIATKAYLEKHLHQPIRTFSSGMKQRVKLILAITSKAPILLLDEPVSNLDAKAKSWYRELIEEFLNDRLIIVCSNNIQDEHFFCNKTLNIEEYKS